MQLAMIGLGRMGSGMTVRLLQGGHQVMVFDRSAIGVPYPGRTRLKDSSATRLPTLVNRVTDLYHRAGEVYTDRVRFQ